MAGFTYALTVHFIWGLAFLNLRWAVFIIHCRLVSEKKSRMLPRDGMT